MRTLQNAQFAALHIKYKAVEQMRVDLRMSAAARPFRQAAE